MLWRNNSTGQLYTWLMSGVDAIAAASPGNNYLGGNIERIADFNGDGKADILWRNSGTGQVYVWQMDGTAIGVEGIPIIVDDLNWGIQK